MSEIENKLDRILEGQNKLQESFNTLSSRQVELELSVTNLEKKVDNISQKNETEVNNIIVKTKELEASLTFINEMYEENKKNNNELKNKVDTLEKLSEDLYTKLASVSLRAEQANDIGDSVENQGRKHMLEIDGIPSNVQEEKNDRNWCHNIVVKMCSLLGIDEVKSDVDVAHRLHNNRIIVTFKNRTSRNKFYYARFNLKGKSIQSLGFQKPTEGKGLIWINESLTGVRKSLLSTTKAMLEKAGFHIGKNGLGLYTSLGNIKVNSGGKVFNVVWEKDISKIINTIKKTPQMRNVDE